MSADQYLIQKVIDHLTGNVTWVAPTTLYVSLYVAADCLVEVSGGSYARQVLSLPAVATNGYSVANTGSVSYTSMPGTQVGGAGIHDALTGGNRLIFAALPSVVTVSAGATFTFAAANLVLSGM